MKGAAFEDDISKNNLAGGIAVRQAIAALWRRLPTYRKCPPIQRLLRADRFCRRAEIEVVPIKSAFLALCSVP